MKIVSIVQQKGGAGKTTLACLLASGAQSMGVSVHCIDGDRNAQLGEWQRRSQNHNWEVEKPAWPDNLVTSELVGTIDDFYARLNELERAGTDLVIVDTRPGSNEDTEDIAYAADLVLVPTRAVPADYELAIKTHEWLLSLRQAFADLEKVPEVKMVLSDASPAIIEAMGPKGSLAKLTRTETEILSELVQRPFMEAAVPQSQICRQLPFLGPLGPAADAFAQSPGGKLREQSIRRLLAVGEQLAREVLDA